MTRGSGTSYFEAEEGDVCRADRGLSNKILWLLVLSFKDFPGQGQTCDLFWFSFIFSQLQRLRQLSYCVPVNLTNYFIILGFAFSTSSTWWPKLAVVAVGSLQKISNLLHSLVALLVQYRFNVPLTPSKQEALYGSQEFLWCALVKKSDDTESDSQHQIFSWKLQSQWYH